MTYEYGTLDVFEGVVDACVYSDPATSTSETEAQVLSARSDDGSFVLSPSREPTPEEPSSTGVWDVGDLFARRWGGGWGGYSGRLPTGPGAWIVRIKLSDDEPPEVVSFRRPTDAEAIAIANGRDPWGET